MTSDEQRKEMAQWKRVRAAIGALFIEARKAGMRTKVRLDDAHYVFEFLDTRKQQKRDALTKPKPRGRKKR